jgi:hypothetical protein
MQIGRNNHCSAPTFCWREAINFQRQQKQTISIQQATQSRIQRTNLESFSINETDCIIFFKKSLF